MEISPDKMKIDPEVTGSSKKGGLKTLPFIIANESFEKVAGFGLQANMILYLKREYHLSNAAGAYVLFLWSAISNFLPIIGAFLSDSFLSRFRVIGIGTVISLLGMTVLWLTSILPAARPPDCHSQNLQNCVSPNPAQLALLFSSFALMSIGAGGIRPCSMAFAADQFYNPSNPKNKRVLQTLFNWYYTSVGVSLIIAVTVIVYIQDRFGWVVGLGIPVGLMLFSTVMYFLGSALYVKVDANKSLFTSFAQVIVAAWKKKHLALPPRDEDGFYYHKGSKIIAPTGKISFLNKACVIRESEKELDCDGWAVEPWSLCSVRQVEELKALIKVLPIWSTGIMIAVTISQQSFPILQASIMDRRLIGELKIPPASFGVFGILTLTVWLALYDRIIVPLLSKMSTTRQRGLTFKERMGIGLAISSLAMAVAAQVEKRRRAAALRQGLAENPYGVVNMSAKWLIAQHCLTGLAEAFNAIGQIEFYYSQFPKSMASIGVALLTLGLAVGNVVGSLIVAIVNDVTKKGGRNSWVSNNFNKGHYDYYYWLISFLCLINVFYYLACSWAYGSCQDITLGDEGDEGTKEEEFHGIIGSPTEFLP